MPGSLIAQASGLLAVLLGLSLVYLLIRAFWEPTLLEITQIDSSHYGRENATGEQVQPALRVLLFSDIHAEHLRLSDQRLVEAMVQAKPDLLLFAGDLTAKTHALPRALGLISRIRTHPDLSACPFFAVPGNHDTPEVRAQLRKLGVPILVNQTVAVDWHGQSWLIMGLDDLRHGKPDFSKIYTEAALSAVPVNRRIILAHNPDCLDELEPNQACWFMGGHFHGGQIWAPFQLEFRLLRSEKLPRTGYYKGAQLRRSMNAYISRGLGCVAIPLRLFSKPELTLFLLRD